MHGKKIGRREIDMTDGYLIERGYKEYPPTRFDNERIISIFQKRFDDDFGKKYFITVNKWSWEDIPESRRDEWYKPFSYEYGVQVSMYEKESYINLKFFSDNWELEEVESFMEDFFEKMEPNYYENWYDGRSTRPERNANS